jgi:hypothetical protein
MDGNISTPFEEYSLMEIEVPIDLNSEAIIFASVIESDEKNIIGFLVLNIHFVFNFL